MLAVVASCSRGAPAPTETVRSAVHLDFGGCSKKRVYASVGFLHSCALLSDGTAECWGNNDHGELGNGTVGGPDAPTPTPVTRLTGITALSAGDYHNCALLRDTTVWCWGVNPEGELGNGTNKDSGTPVLVSGLTGVTSVIAGFRHTCALKSDGSVWCWGQNVQGDLGTLSQLTFLTPIAVAGVSNATAIALGNQHTCALIAGGTVKCWGDNNGSELANQAIVGGTPTPTQIPNLSGVTAINAGDQHTCALLANKTVTCWGTYTQWSPRATALVLPNPTVISGLGNVVTLHRSSGSSDCVSLGDNSVSCWGDNSNAELATGGIFISPPAVDVPSLGAFATLETGALHSCGVTPDGSLACWGDQEQGELGNGQTAVAFLTTPVTVADEGLSPAGQICRPASDVCDVAETCTGTSATCPSDGFAPGGTVCRAPAGTCDLAEKCTGGSASCPPDAFLPAGAICGFATDTFCQTDALCGGGTPFCPFNGPVPRFCEPAASGQTSTFPTVGTLSFPSTPAWTGEVRLDSGGGCPPAGAYLIPGLPSSPYSSFAASPLGGPDPSQVCLSFAGEPAQFAQTAQILHGLSAPGPGCDLSGWANITTSVDPTGQVVCGNPALALSAPAGAANGTTCTDPSSCASGVCAQGVCCATDCTGTCQSCALTGNLGTCTPVPIGADPLNQCTDSGATTCGTDGSCNGAGGCRLYASGTTCVPATCSGSTLTPARTCDGGGNCQIVSTSSCGPFVCDNTTSACKTSCGSNADCLSPDICIGGSCVPPVNLKVQYQVGDRNSPNAQIFPHLQVVNTGSSAIPLSSLTMRYWYTIDTPGIGELTDCYYAALGCFNIINLTNAAVAPALPGADHYFQVGFTSGAGTLQPGGSTGEIQVAFHKIDWSNYDQTNDYSFDPTKSTYADWGRVTLYWNGTLVWGIEPGSFPFCKTTTDCPANHFCVDSVCCDAACGGGDPTDCQACSVAAGASADGTCTILGSSTTCRAAAGPCDVAEACNGSSPACPANAFLDQTTICHLAANACESTVTCSGSSATCAPSTPLPCTTSVQGTVSWDGAPVTGTAATNLKVVGAPNSAGAPSTLLWNATVDPATGFYHSDGVTPANYNVVLSGESCGNAEGNDQLASVGVSVGAGTTTTANLDISGSAGLVTGTIIRGGAPVAGATIDVNNGDCTTLIADANGQFAMFFRTGTYTATPTISGTVLPAFSFSVPAGQTTDLSASIGGQPGDNCASVNECGAGLFCVDGVCCTSDCGGGDTSDCQACSVKAGGTSNGTCTALPTTHICNNAVAGEACDADDYCDGITAFCPDIVKDKDTVCGTSSGVCDVAGKCDGLSPDCPANTFAAKATKCFTSPPSNACEVDRFCSGDSATCPSPDVPAVDCPALPTGQPATLTFGLPGGADADPSQSGWGITISFTDVTLAGHLSLVESDTGPEPLSGFQVLQFNDGTLGPYHYWYFKTDATYVGDANLKINICIHYDQSWLTGPNGAVDESNIHIEHWDSNNVGMNISGSNMPDTANNKICGNVDSLSPFALIAPLAKAIPKVTVPGPIVVEAPGPAGAKVTFSASATDPKDGSITPVCTPASGSTFKIGTTPVTCKATDSLSFFGSASFTVTVRDTVGPPITGVPAPIVAYATCASGAVVTYPTPTAVDAVDGKRTVTCAPASGTMFALGQKTVTCTASDTRGNTSTATFSVWVKVQAPTDGTFFQQPINPDGSSIFKLGSTVPVKFKLTGASAGITNLVAKLTVAKVSNNVTGTYVEATSTSAADSGSTFRYDATNKQYILNLSTKTMTTGTWSLRADLGDLVPHTVNVSLK